MEFMPQYAPFVTLAFLGTCFALGVIAVLIVYALARSKRRLVSYAGGAALATAGAYVAVLLAASLTSREKVLNIGEQKYFCAIDCHVAYSVVNVATSKALGAPPSQATAAGTFYVVKLKAWFDERTISSRRGYSPLTPDPRRVIVVDDRGREFNASLQGLRALNQAQGQATPLTKPLRPGESYTTVLVFDLPAEAQNPRLFLTDASSITRLLIGHENSPFHRKILFRLAPQANSTALVGR